jgi:hypothetical protein
MWLNSLCYDYNLFPNSYTVFRAGRLSTNKTRGSGEPIALSSRMRSYILTCNIQWCDLCTWAVIHASKNVRLLFSNNLSL